MLSSMLIRRLNHDAAFTVFRRRYMRGLCPKMMSFKTNKYKSTLCSLLKRLFFSWSLKTKHLLISKCLFTFCSHIVQLTFFVFYKQHSLMNFLSTLFWHWHVCSFKIGYFFACHVVKLWTCLRASFSWWSSFCSLRVKLFFCCCFLKTRVQQQRKLKDDVKDATN